MAGSNKLLKYAVWVVQVENQTLGHDLNTSKPLHTNFSWVLISFYSKTKQLVFFAFHFVHNGYIYSHSKSPNDVGQL